MRCSNKVLGHHLGGVHLQRECSMEAKAFAFMLNTASDRHLVNKKHDLRHYLECMNNIDWQLFQ